MHKLTVSEVLNQIEHKDFELIFLALSGSHAYGLNTPESDYDYRGIGIPSLQYFFTTKNFEQAEDKTHDITIYSIMKFFQLAKNVNPNIIEMFYIDNEDHILYIHPIMKKIKKHRHLFLSKKAQHSFSGYAFAQLKRIQGHYKWLQNPLTKPDRKDYKLGPVPSLSKEKIRSLMSLGSDDLIRITQNNESLMDELKNEMAFQNDSQNYQRYNEWKTNRNEKRAALEAKCGYDSKHAMHLFRLLRMAKEIASEKTIHVDRPDKEFLMKIRNGHFTYDDILYLADKELKEIEEIYEQSDLPHSVNHQQIDELLFTILKEFFNF